LQTSILLQTIGGFGLLELFNGNLKLYLGKSEPFILIDTNRYANDEDEQFVGRAFVNNPLIDPKTGLPPWWELTGSYPRL